MTDPKRPLAWGGGQEMTELESTMWRANKHPENSTQGGVLEVLADTPDWEAVRRWHDYGLGEFPRFKQKVVQPAVPVGPPVWVDDPDFDLDHHLSRVDLGGSATHQDLLACTQELALIPLDAERPPWHGYMIEGLEGGRSAYFLIVSHCLMDGHGSVQLLGDLHTRPAAAAETAGSGTGAAVVSQSSWDVARGQVTSRLFGLPKLAGKVAGVAIGAVTKPRQSVQFASSVGRVLAPPPASSSQLLSSGDRTNWAYGTMTCDLSALRAAGKAVGGTINDAYVCAILGGLRRYHENVGQEMGDPVINMPVSVRRDGDSKGGNKFAAAFISAPGSVVDPAERMKALRAVVDRVSKEPALDFFSIVLPVLNRAPVQLLTPLFTGMQNRTDVTISNVPGMSDETKLLGAVVDAVYYFGPLPGSPVMVVLHSHAGKACIGVNCDGDVFEVRALMECLQAGLDEILALAG